MQKKDWVLTEGSLDRLLARLDPDRERAGEVYENLRRVLISFFEWRGCVFPEDQADETLNRVARKIEEGEQIQDFRGYCYGVARRLWLEVAQEQGKELKRRVAPEELSVASAPVEENPEKEARLACFERCLHRLPAESRALIVQYYQSEKRGKIDNRAGMAKQLGVSLNSLRVRAYRIRAQLDECISRCLRQAPAGV
ncbi:MAG TPA: sigma-70 family RNA polymerase sigma factor [Blastocatellia bacterium]|nr:sigma-70 family RNA polymerase sigma factor [Blastocatellia bacterium]